MSDKNVKALVKKIMITLRSLVDPKWQSNRNLRKEIPRFLDYTESALTEIFKLVSEKKYEQAALAAERVAPELGNLGAPWLIDIFAKIKSRNLSSIKPSLLCSAAWAYKQADDPTVARKRFQQARRLAISRSQWNLAASIAIDLGVLAYERNDLRNANYWYEKAKQEAEKISDYYTQAKAYNNLAGLILDSDPCRARDLLDKSLSLRSKANIPADSMVPALVNFGIALSKIGEHAKAYDKFQEALKILQKSGETENLPLVLLDLANAAAGLGRYGEASQIYQKALAKARQSGDLEIESLIREGYALCAFENERYKIAGREYEARHNLLMKLDRKREAATTLYDAAVSNSRSGDLATARKLAKSAVARFRSFGDKDWQRRCLLLIATEIEKPTSDLGLDLLRKAVALRGGRDRNLKFSARRTLWDALIKRGRYKEASFELSKEIRLMRVNKKELRDRLYDAGMVLLAKGRQRSALRLLRKAYHLSEDGDLVTYALIRQDLAVALVENHRFEEAHNLLKENLSLASHRKDTALRATTLGNLGVLERRMGKYQDAVALLKEAADISKDLNDLEEAIDWFDNLALAMFDLGHRQEAERILQKALQMAKKSSNRSDIGRVQSSLGYISAQNGQFVQAEKYYSKAIELAEDEGLEQFELKTLIARAYTLYHQNKRKAALKEIRKIAQRALDLALYEDLEEISKISAFWAIEWRHPAKAGMLVAVNFLANLMIEKAQLKNSVTLVASAKENFTSASYAQFNRAMRRQILKSESTGRLWKQIVKIEKEISDYMASAELPRVTLRNLLEQH